MKMNKMMPLGLLSLFLPVFALADVCTELANNYNNRLLSLQRDIQAVLSQTTDPAEQSAIRQSYQIQRDQLVMERDAALASAGCGQDVPQLPDDPIPPQDPGPVLPPTPDPTPDPDPDPTPDPTPDPDPSTDPTPVPGEDPKDCPPAADRACLDQLDAYADQLRAQGVRQNEFVHKMQAKIRELGCVKNYGGWQSHWAKKCDKKPQPKKCDKKSAPKKCDPKPKKCPKR